MKNIYAVEDTESLNRYRSFADKHRERFEKYLAYLKTEYSVSELPNAILWTSAENAAKVLSNIPIPAYTNDFRTVFCPDIESWQEIYLKQLEGLPDSEAVSCIRRYYRNNLTENHILQILGHEFVHHSALFPEDEYTSGIWFEEGMCEYISRKYFLTDDEFSEEARINAQLEQLLRNQYGTQPIEEFGSATYLEDYAGIFYAYWRSYLAIQKIIKSYNGDIGAVFSSYQKWLHCEQEISLREWFGADI